MSRTAANCWRSPVKRWRPCGDTMHKAEEVKKRISGAEDLLSIVKTMKALSAVRIHRYEEAAEAVMEYFHTVELGLQVVLDKPPGPAPGDGEGGTALLVFGSGQGMCGSFNETLARYARRQAEWLPAPPDRLVAVGNHIGGNLAEQGFAVDDTLEIPATVDEITGTVRRLVIEIERWYTGEAIGQVWLCYNRTTGRYGYEPGRFRLLPVDSAWLEALSGRAWPTKRLPVHRAERQDLYSELIRQYYFVTLYRSFAQSLAAEYAGRLAAMQSAEQRIGETLDALESRYRRQRQEEITAEILDIISGYEVLRTEEESQSESLHCR